MAVAFKEVAGSPKEWYAPEGMRAQREFLVAWANRGAFVKELLGNGYTYGGTTRATYPDAKYLAATKVSCEAFADDVTNQSLTDHEEDLNSYGGLAKVIVDYEIQIRETDYPHANIPIRPDTPSDTYLSYRMDIGCEAMPFPPDTLLWETTDEPVPPTVPAYLRVPVTAHQLTWHRIISPPWTAIAACRGKINDAIFPPKTGITKGHLLFDGATADREYLTTGNFDKPNIAWRLTYTFLEKTIEYNGSTYSWEHVYRSLPENAPGWERLKDGNGKFLYQDADFTSLFKYEESDD